MKTSNTLKNGREQSRLLRFRPIVERKHYGPKARLPYAFLNKRLVEAATPEGDAYRADWSERVATNTFAHEARRATRPAPVSEQRVSVLDDPLAVRCEACNGAGMIVGIKRAPGEAIHGGDLHECYACEGMGKVRP